MARRVRDPLNRNRHLLLVLAVAWALGWYATHFEPINTWVHARHATPATRCIDIYKQREELLIDCEFASFPTWAAYRQHYNAADHSMKFQTYYDRFRDPDILWWWVAVPVSLLVLDVLWTIYLAGRRRHAARREAREDAAL